MNQTCAYTLVNTEGIPDDGWILYGTDETYFVGLLGWVTYQVIHGRYGVTIW